MLPDIPRLYTAVSEWLACMLVIIFADKRFNKVQTWVICIAALAVIISFHLVAGILPLGFWVPCMILAVVLMCLFIWLATKHTIQASVYLGVQVFIIAEFISSVEWWLYYFFSTNYEILNNTPISVVFAVVLYAVFYTIMFFIERRFSSKKIRPATLKDMFTAILIVVTAFLISNISFMDWNTPLSGQYALQIFYIID